MACNAALQMTTRVCKLGSSVCGPGQGRSMRARLGCSHIIEMPGDRGTPSCGPCMRSCRQHAPALMPMPYTLSSEQAPRRLGIQAVVSSSAMPAKAPDASGRGRARASTTLGTPARARAVRRRSCTRGCMGALARPHPACTQAQGRVTLTQCSAQHRNAQQRSAQGAEVCSGSECAQETGCCHTPGS